jgi:hypothetical protein
LTVLRKWDSLWPRVPKTQGSTNGEKEADMKRLLTLIVALGVAALFSSATLVGADCSYHKTQAAVDTTDASKNVATTTVKTDTGQVQTAQAEQPVKPAPEVKK